jgi:hypothetical protein
VHPLLLDPWIAAQVDAAVAPYVGRLPGREVAWMRDQLADTLASDASAAKLLRRSRPTIVEESGEVRRGAAPVLEDATERLAPILGDARERPPTVSNIDQARRPKAG